MHNLGDSRLVCVKNTYASRRLRVGTLGLQRVREGILPGTRVVPVILRISDRTLRVRLDVRANRGDSKSSPFCDSVAEAWGNGFAEVFVRLLFCPAIVAFHAGSRVPFVYPALDRLLAVYMLHHKATYIDTCQPY